LITPIEQFDIKEPDHETQKWYIILLQVLFPFCIAGLGMVLAGVIFDIVQVIY
jgi:hypothetical protein